MLDGILGRGFSSNCKSSIKSTKTRIDAIRRKRVATQKFLKKDIADLVANGFDDIAYGRAEGLLVELGLSSCYDLVELSCQCILKHLSAMQKQSGCPEECKMAVSSLMFAASRFSDLPELRDLRNLFQHKYGNSLEYYVNQEFVETLASKPPTLETKIKLLQEIASEFSIKWDSRGLDLRLSKPPASPLNQQKAYGSPSPGSYKWPNGKNDNYKFPDGKESLSRLYKHDSLANVMHEQEQTTGSNCDVSKRDEDTNFFGSYNNSKNKPPRIRQPNYPDAVNHDTSVQPGVEFRAEHYESCNGTKEQITKNRDRPGQSSHGKQLEYFGDTKLNNGTGNMVPKRDESFPCGKPAPPSGAEFPGKNHHKESSFADGNHYAREKPVMSIRNGEGEAERLKAIPPPYTKSSHSRHGVNIGSKNAGYGAPLDADAGRGLVGMRRGADCPIYDRQGFGPARVNSQEEQQLNEDEINPTPRRRSSRRRHLKSPPTDSIEGSGAVERSSSSRRRDKSRTDEEEQLNEDEINPTPRRRSSRRRRHLKPPPNCEDVHSIEGTGTAGRRSSSSRRRRDKSRTDEEEKMIDKLLIHYSKKPSSLEAADAAAGIQKQKYRSGDGDGPEKDHPPRPPPSRSISLPNDHVSQVETPTRVITRAVTMQPARHVHPKLPDYDDLAATFAAMKGK